MVVQIDLEDEHSKKPNFPFTMHIAEGNKYFHMSKFQLAISCYNSVIKFDPTNVQALLGRAKCLVRLGLFDEARKSAEEILQIHPKCAEAFYIKGETEYFRGNFERGLISFLNGFKVKPNSKNLKNGFELCKKALSDFSSKRLPTVDDYDVKQLSQTRKKKSFKATESSLKPCSHDSIFVRSLHSELKFSEKLVEVYSRSSAHPACKELRTFLNRRTKFWKAQNPSLTKKLSENNNLESAKLMLQECERHLSEGRREVCILKGFDVLEYLDSLPNRGRRTLIVKAHAFHLMGLASMKKNEFSTALEYFSKELKVSEEFNISKMKYRSWRSIGELHLLVRKFTNAKEAFEKCLEFLESCAEEPVLRYKIAECEMNCGRLRIAADVAEKALELAEANQDYRLQFDIKMLQAEIAIKGKKTEDAKSMYQDALEIAIQNSDPRLEKVKSLLEWLNEKPDHEPKMENIHHASRNLIARLQQNAEIRKILTGKKQPS